MPTFAGYPKEEEYTGISYFQGKKNRYELSENMLKYFAEKGIDVKIEEIGGSVEIATGIGLADGIFDIVSTGSTLIMNGLKEVDAIVKSEAVLIANKSLNDEKKALLENLLFRIRAYKKGSGSKYIVMNAPTNLFRNLSNFARNEISQHSSLGRRRLEQHSLGSSRR
jgi:ATP phosphoribosyltransferase